MGGLILELRLFLLLLKIKGSLGVNEIKKIAPNRKQREFVKRSLHFLNCGEKLFSSSFRNLVDAVAGSSDKNSMKYNKKMGGKEASVGVSQFPPKILILLIFSSKVRARSHEH